MNLKKCLNGHLFDRDRYDNCPFCGSVQWSSELNSTEPKTRQPWDNTGISISSNKSTTGLRNNEGIKGSDSTVLLDPTFKNNPNLPKEDYVICLNCRKKNVYEAKFCEACGKPLVRQNNSSDIDNNILVNQFKAVVGWIVGVSGVYFGKSFEIHPGRNSIGNGLTCNICLVEDKLIQDDCLTWLTFDPRKNIYYIQPADAKGIVYINNQVLLNARLLIDRDRIQMGDGEYIFIPLCDTKYKWNDYVKAAKV